GVFNMTPFGGTDIFIMKLDAGGNFVWAKQIGGIGDQSSNKIGIDVAQNIYVTGTFSGPADFDPGPGSYIFTATGSYNTFILKLNKDGNFIWAKTIEGYYSGTTSMAIDAQKNVITTGEFERTSDFDPGPGLFNMTAISNRGNIFVHKLSQVCLTNTFHTLNVSTCISFLLNENVYDSSGTYTQIIPNAAGCDSTITLNLIINRKFTSVNATICEGQTYYAGGSNQTTAGIYKDTLLTSLGCDSVITTDLKVNPKPKPDLGPDGNICTNSQGSITPGLFNSYIWQDNSTQPTFTVNNPGNYWVTVTDANNCSATDTLNIISIDTIPKNFLPPNQDLCYGNVLKITVPNYFTYQWSTGSTGDFIDVSKFGTYYLTVKDFNSCTGTDSITIQRKNCIYMGIPNAFTPNGDTKNDIFKPEIFQAVKAFSFIVFNRYGQTVFETREYGKGWDGTLKGKPQPSGSYVYYIKYTNIFGVETIENGSVLLIR
ncbi:MAG: gliding motility-associated C-terminal domain-containing protein, partial [Ferruginibacter sp.]